MFSAIIHISTNEGGRSHALARHTGSQVRGHGVLVVQVNVRQGIVQFGVSLVDVVTGLLVSLAAGVTASTTFDDVVLQTSTTFDDVVMQTSTTYL